jgi:hypothetical protein
MAKLSIECLEDRTVPTVIFNANVPIDGLAVIPKTGHLVQVSGPLHIVLEETFDSSGGLHIKEHMQPQGVSGVDLTTGAKYQGTGVTLDMEIVTANGAINFTFVNNFRLIGQGPNNNYTVHENTQFTFNANGILTATVDNLMIDQGSGG